ncbi:MAG: phosphoribosylamine--glycine ligase [Candidatus Omnitrophica bacterium]|nr:phosphoribosylamine--glycine ligase [Candidatus Omnitrophota bacterium]
MKILILGSGGREDALCWKISQSPKVSKLYCVPGNPGTARYAENRAFDITDNAKVVEFCKSEKIDLVLVGPELPLTRGVTDALEKENIKVCGPSYAAARLESSKIFTKEILGRYNVPTASFRIFDNIDKAGKYVESKAEELPIVIKADGLAQGKGVVVAKTVEEAKAAIEDMLVKRKFGAAGNNIVIEKCLKGEEVSVIIMTDGTNIVPMASSQDHKRAYDGDEGPNTGGMGAYSPAPVLTERMHGKIEEDLLRVVIDGMRKEEMPYKGILYGGIMLTAKGPKILEFNVRFGDPEAQAILPRLKSDFVELINATAEKNLASVILEWENNFCVCVVLASAGYPGEYQTGKEITGIEEAEKTGALVFHAGTAMKDGKLVTAGGRVLNVVGKGRDVQEAIENAYRGVAKIKFEGMHYRKDIGHKAL